MQQFGPGRGGRDGAQHVEEALADAREEEHSHDAGSSKPGSESTENDAQEGGGDGAANAPIPDDLLAPFIPGGFSVPGRLLVDTTKLLTPIYRAYDFASNLRIRDLAGATAFVSSMPLLAAATPSVAVRAGRALTAAESAGLISPSSAHTLGRLPAWALGISASRLSGWLASAPLVARLSVARIVAASVLGMLLSLLASWCKIRWKTRFTCLGDRLPNGLLEERPLLDRTAPVVEQGMRSTVQIDNAVTLKFEVPLISEFFPAPEIVVHTRPAINRQIYVNFVPEVFRRVSFRHDDDTNLEVFERVMRQCVRTGLNRTDIGITAETVAFCRALWQWHVAQSPHFPGQGGRDLRH